MPSSSTIRSASYFPKGGLRVLKFLAVLFGVVAAVGGCLLWALLPDRRIAGNWRDPELHLEAAKIHELRDGGGILVSYFFGLSQSADLLHPHKVNKGGAWENEVTERVHWIARGYETLILDPSGQHLAELSIDNNVTDFCYLEQELYLKATWSYYSEDGLYRVDVESGTAAEFHPPAKILDGLQFQPMESMAAAEFSWRFPAIEGWLRSKNLHGPGPRNLY